MQPGDASFAREVTAKKLGGWPAKHFEEAKKKIFKETIRVLAEW